MADPLSPRKTEKYAIKVTHRMKLISITLISLLAFSTGTEMFTCPIQYTRLTANHGQATHSQFQMYITNTSAY